MKTIKDVTKVDQTLFQKRVGVENVEKEQTELKLRGNDNDVLSKAIKEGLFYEGEKDTVKAIAAYEKAINLMAEPMNNLSWLDFQFCTQRLLYFINLCVICSHSSFIVYNFNWGII